MKWFWNWIARGFVTREDHDRRVTELLEYSNMTLERARTAERRANDFRVALEETEKVIMNAAEGAWGYDFVGDYEVPNGVMTWPVKEEHLYWIRKVLHEDHVANPQRPGMD